MLPINCDVVGILIKRHASPFVNDTSNYQKKQICTCLLYTSDAADD